MNPDAIKGLLRPMSDAEFEELMRQPVGERPREDSVTLEEVGLLHDADEQAFMRARNNVSDEELVARINAAPDMGGAILVELSEFMQRRAAEEESQGEPGAPA